MSNLQAELEKRKQKLLYYSKSFRNREAVSQISQYLYFVCFLCPSFCFQNLPNLKHATTIIRYTLKYLNKYPADFKGVFLAWLDYFKVGLMKEWLDSQNPLCFISHPFHELLFCCFYSQSGLYPSLRAESPAAVLDTGLNCAHARPQDPV